MKPEIKIEVTAEVAITADEFRERTVGKLPERKLDVGDVVRYVGEYKQPTIACVDGLERRVGGYIYHAVRLTRNGTSRVQFSEGDVIEKLGGGV